MSVADTAGSIAKSRLIDKWDNHVAVFFASFTFALTTIGTNVCSIFLSFVLFRIHM